MSEVILFLGISLSIIISGPFCDYIKDENRYIQSYKKINDLKEPLKWPDLILCKSPMIKNQENYLNLMTQKFENESEFQILTKKVFFTQPKEFVYAIGIGPTYELGPHFL